MKPSKLVLLVDDDEDDRTIFCSAVAALNEHWECTTAEDGESALNLLQSMAILPDYIFLDLNMPGEGGMTCLVEIKKINDLRSVPIIIYTTAAHPDQKNAAFKLGADYFLVKPALFDDIVAGIAMAIKEVSRVKSRAGHR